MDEKEELLALTAQRDALAHFIFKEGRGSLVKNCCDAEIAEGRCPYDNLRFGEDKEAEVCASCIVRVIGKASDMPPKDPFFSWLAKYRARVTCHIIGDILFDGRVETVNGDTVTFLMNGRKKTVRMDEISVLTLSKTLRWSAYHVTTARWPKSAED